AVDLGRSYWLGIAKPTLAYCGARTCAAVHDGHAIAKACACDYASCAVCASSTVTIARTRGQVIRSSLRDVDGPSVILPGRHAVGIAESSGLHFLRSFGDGRGFRESADRSESTRLNSSHQIISYAVFCLKKK